MTTDFTSRDLLKIRSVFVLLSIVLSIALSAQNIPLPEHPRPDYQREQWQNLNGVWAFAFDSLNEGTSKGWQNGKTDFPLKINVPFPWGSKLSGLDDLADIGWYRREITVDPSWKGQRTFLTIGASDWETTVWLDGELLGKHQGGYVPFSFDLTPHLKYGSNQTLVVRVDDARREFTLYGKQGYGNARGIWQTIYLEARGNEYFEAVHFTPDIDNNKVVVTTYMDQPAAKDLSVSIKIKGAPSPIEHTGTIAAGEHKASFEIDIPGPRLWTLDDPYLYEAEASLEADKVSSYFGMRKISVVDLPGTDYRYIALNNQPVYLQLALDQSYHPEGFYTFPSDQFMKEEIQRSKAIGLNGIRTHIKVEVPRKLYWADKLGLFVMEDLPNSWGEPDKYMQEESIYTLKEMIKRDYNHPSIFSWVMFNETWGLRTNIEKDGKKERPYQRHTQDWVASVYYLAKSLDQTRLVEDNSICCGAGHTETDINSWHAYLPGWEWEEHIKNISDNTHPGSGFDFEDGFTQGNQPNINSECGNVWGYQGSTGDVDWSWDYHRMINTFRKYPKIAGWLYTEHHDVINEWNGYWRFDRSEKETGVGEIVEGMTLNDFHSDIYLSTGNDICLTTTGSSTVDVPLYLSSMTGKDIGNALTISYELSSINYYGEKAVHLSDKRTENYKPWIQAELQPLSIPMPEMTGLAVLKLTVTGADGKALHRNFIHFDVKSDNKDEKTTVIAAGASDFSGQEWSVKQWDALEGKKVNGAGKGYFEYTLELPPADQLKKVKSAYFIAEVSAKELFVKDMDKDFEAAQDYMRGARVAPSGNPNSYPMTDETMFPSKISVLINGKKVHTQDLPDDPADHRGVLSWHNQLKDRMLREAGSYGYLVKVPISKSMLKTFAAEGKVTVRLQTEGEGGMAIYGKEFGRYPFGPSLVLRK